MKNQNSVKTGVNYVYFGSYCETVNFVWNHFDNKFESSDTIDFTDSWKFECDTIPEIAKETFEKEGCVSDFAGLQLGFYDYTFDIYFNDLTNSNNEGFAETFEYCMKFIELAGPNSYFEDYKEGTVSIYCNQTGETVFEKEIK